MEDDREVANCNNNNNCINCGKHLEVKLGSLEVKFKRHSLNSKLGTTSLSVGEGLRILISSFTVPVSKKGANNKKFVCHDCFSLAVKAIVGRTAESDLLDRTSPGSYIGKLTGKWRESAFSATGTGTSNDEEREEVDIDDPLTKLKKAKSVNQDETITSAMNCQMTRLEKIVTEDQREETLSVPDDKTKNSFATPICLFHNTATDLEEEKSSPSDYAVAGFTSSLTSGEGATGTTGSLVDAHATLVEDCDRGNLSLVEQPVRDIHEPPAGRQIPDPNLPRKLDLCDTDPWSDAETGLNSSQISDASLVNSVRTCLGSCPPAAPLNSLQTETCVDSNKTVAPMDDTRSGDLIDSCGTVAPKDDSQTVTYPDSCRTVAPTEGSQTETAVNSERTTHATYWSGKREEGPHTSWEESLKYPTKTTEASVLSHVLAETSTAFEEVAHLDSYNTGVKPTLSSIICSPPVNSGTGLIKENDQTAALLEESQITAPTSVESYQIGSNEQKQVANEIPPSIHSERKCSICFKVLVNKVGLSQHMKIHTTEKHFKCERCDKAFRRPSCLRAHLKTHSGIRPFDCSICQRPFSRKDNLRSHESRHRGEKPYGCEICGKRFNLKSTLQKHMPIHKKAKPHICSVCGKGFTRRVQMLKHFSKHQEQEGCQDEGKVGDSTLPRKGPFAVYQRGRGGSEEPYLCDHCDEGFTSSFDLWQHRLVHHSDKCGDHSEQAHSLQPCQQHLNTSSRKGPYICSICGKAFAIKSYLKSHEGRHRGERRHACGICDKKFNSRSTLKKHIRVHTKEKPYICSLCGRAFAQRVGMLDHFSRHQEQKGSWFKCADCDKTFPTKYQLKVHERIHTGEKPYLCDHCGKGFTSSNSLSHHRRIHNK